MTGETRPDGVTAPVHLRLAGVALALSLVGCASVSGTNGGDAASTGTAAGKGATSSAASASAAKSASAATSTSAITSAADSMKSAVSGARSAAGDSAASAATSAASGAAASTAGDAAASASGNVATAAAGDAMASAAGGEATSAAGDAAASTAGDAATDAATSAAGDALKAAGVPTDLSVDNVTGGVKLSHLTTYDPKDPLQAYNRVMFAFNERADQYALKPVAKAYRFITPKPVQFVVGNFFSNLGDLWTGFNNLLQGKGKAAASDTARFFVNSTLGFLGFADVATELGLEKHNEDFGQTLGWWGVPSGPYFVIPLLGPSTIRDAASRPVDTYGQPYMWQDGHDALKWSLWTVDKVHTRASLLDAENALNDAALDKYTLMRDGWLARRRNQVYDGDPPDEDDAADPYGDDPYADDPYADDPTKDESDSGDSTQGGAGAADRASGAASGVSDKASEATDRVKEAAKKKAGKAADRAGVGKRTTGSGS